MYPLNVLHFHVTVCAILTAFVCWHYHTIYMLDMIPPFLLTSVTWPRPFQPFPRVMGGGGVHTWQSQVFRVHCKAHSHAVCKDKEALFYAQVHRSGAQLCFRIWQQRRQCTEKQQWSAPAVSKRSNKQLRLQIQEKWPLLQRTVLRRQIQEWWPLASEDRAHGRKHWQSSRATTE